MFHEDLQADVISENDLTGSVVVTVVGDRRIQLRKKETCLTAMLVTLHQLGHRESIGHEGFCICHRSSQQVPEVLMFRLVGISGLSPLGDGASLVDDDVEISVKE
eukprot:CAMPEP_0197848180 /NCGR_PEP_ID=MMETSP1438-20131217/7968_1 /TAXON_ID=1461541 /ORGANISM="Pterosperma sp., Strain CCMP1384" /LENGTH=104 /DNA_ID=CAMNT_0043460319 /DNA_START=654 /DNA_END=968 /DNA_ORIENTATION=-